MRVFSEQSTQRFNDFGKRGSSPTAFPKTARPFFALPPFTFQKNKVVKHFEVSAGHGDSAALREITRRWSFHRTRRGLRPSAFLCGIPFGFKDESGDPGRCFRKSHRHPRAQSKLSPQKQILKVKGGKSFFRIDARAKNRYFNEAASLHRRCRELPALFHAPGDTREPGKSPLAPFLQRGVGGFGNYFL